MHCSRRSANIDNKHKQHNNKHNHYNNKHQHNINTNNDEVKAHLKYCRLLIL